MNAFFNELKCGIPKRQEEETKWFEKEFPTLLDDCRGTETDEETRTFTSRMRLSYSTQMIYRWHFGFRGKLRPQEIISKGVDLARTYFALVGEGLAKAKPGMDWTEEIAWFEQYSDALLLTTLAGRLQDRRELSDFLHPNLAPAASTVGPSTDPVLGDVLLCVAASFQSSPMNTAPLEGRLKKSSKKRPKLLLDTWQALKSDDREKFAAKLADCTAEFAKRSADDDRPLTAVALLESILAGLAYERGWTDLSFDLPIAARLVTHRSLEIG